MTTDFLLHLILLLIFNSLMIVGLFNASTYKLNSDVMIVPKIVRKQMIDPNSTEVLSWLRIRIENMFGETLSRPLITCPQCMASVHSLIPYFIFNYDPALSAHAITKIILIYPMYICALSALNIFINSKIQSVKHQ